MKHFYITHTKVLLIDMSNFNYFEKSIVKPIYALQGRTKLFCYQQQPSAFYPLLIVSYSTQSVSYHPTNRNPKNLSPEMMEAIFLFTPM